MEAKPLKIVPTANSVKQEEELIDFELGMSDVKRTKTSGVIKPLLTSVQLYELHLQTVIYNHIAAGVAVPGHLVHHVWKGLASSWGYALLNKLFPNSIQITSQGFESRIIIDSEPGRCRRTDGKKWRCSRSVLPDQKYCERHMHRGCQRSRKLVEASKDVALTETKPSSKPKVNFETLNVGPPVPGPVGPQLVATSSTNVHENNNSSIPTPPCIDEMNRCATVNRNTLATISTTTDIFAESRTLTTSSTDNVCVANNNESLDGKHDINNRLGESLVTSSNSRHNVKIVSNASLGFGFSPRSVLQVVGCDGSQLVQPTNLEPNPGRCRRTDGKKWRCSREVLPCQKYCGRHMHRGAKKYRVGSQLDSPFNHPAPPSGHSHPMTTVPKKVDPHPSSVGSPSVAIPRRLGSLPISTNLTISTPANAQALMYNNHTLDISSSSDTTISDNIPAYRNEEVSSRT